MDYKGAYMIIVNKNRTEAYNTEQITNYYIGSDDTSIKVSAGAATRGGILGKYDTFEETKAAMGIMLSKIGMSNNSTGVIYMPDDDDVRKQLRITENKASHHIAGKKTKGHGGS